MRAAAVCLSLFAFFFCEPVWGAEEVVSVKNDCKAQWIWSTARDKDAWVAFRKTIELSATPSSAVAAIAVDSRYWLWVNGTLIIRESGLLRGPNKNDTYYEEVDLKPHLKKGKNQIAILVNYFGKHSFGNNDSGKGGLLFEAVVDGKVFGSDASWKAVEHPAFEVKEMAGEHARRLSATGVRFDAAKDMSGWTQEGFSDASWPAAQELGTPPCKPWNRLVLRNIPHWKVHEPANYLNADKLGLPQAGYGGKIECKTPYNGQFYPSFTIVSSKPGLLVKVYGNNLVPDFQTQYLTRGDGKNEEFEMPFWINGEYMIYEVPEGVEVKELKFRETSYHTEQAGSFECDDPFLNKIWKMAARTALTNMRDTYYDCPDRERAFWTGDAMTITMQIAFHAFDRNAWQLTRHCIPMMVDWQSAKGGIACGPEVGPNRRELPCQTLAVIGMEGLWNYYQYSGDKDSIAYVYPHVKKYLLEGYEFEADGLLKYRNGDWDWVDYGNVIEGQLLQHGWYYLALQAATEMAKLTGNDADVAGFQERMEKIRKIFNPTFWNTAKNGYITSDEIVGKDKKKRDITQYHKMLFKGEGVDERASAMPVLCGFADKDQWPGCLEIIKSKEQSSPWMDFFILKSLFVMREPDAAFARMKSKKRYSYIMDPKREWSTLAEFLPGGGTNCHGWAGGPLVILSRYVSGIEPIEPAFKKYQVLPQLGALKKIKTVVSTVRRPISLEIERGDGHYSMVLTSPLDTEAVVGIPKVSLPAMKSIKANGTVVWQDGKHVGALNGLAAEPDDENYIKFRLQPGTWKIEAM